MTECCQRHRRPGWLGFLPICVPGGARFPEHVPGPAPVQVAAQDEEEIGEPVDVAPGLGVDRIARSEEHTSELQSLMRITYADFCLKKKIEKHKKKQTNINYILR